MCARSANNCSAVADALRQASRIVLTTHVRPDGDALGSVVALYVAAGRAGKDCHMVIAGGVPRRYAFLFERRPLDQAEDFGELAAAAELVVVVDTCSYGQLGPLAETLRASLGKTAIIDHHVTADVPARVVWRDESAAAAGVMVAELLKALSWPVDVDVAEALMTAICSDTGWLRYANTDGLALRVAAELVEAGARPDALAAKLHQSDRPQRVKLLAAALRSLELHADGRLGVMVLTQEDFARAGAVPEETEDFANEPLRIATVAIAALLVAEPDGVVRTSLRSREVADVAEIAASFGGGGHARAAGFRARDNLATVKQRLIAACGEAIRASGA